MATMLKTAVSRAARKSLPTKMSRPEMPESITKQNVLGLYLHLLRAKNQLKLTDKQFYIRRLRREFEKRRNETDKSKIRVFFERGAWMLQSKLGGLQ